MKYKRGKLNQKKTTESKGLTNDQQRDRKNTTAVYQPLIERKTRRLSASSNGNENHRIFYNIMGEKNNKKLKRKIKEENPKRDLCPWIILNLLY